MKRLCLLLTICLPLVLCGQNSETVIEIQGRILNKETKVPVCYANVFNKHSLKGTISNTDGYFKISLLSPKDSIVISCIGYEKQFIAYSKKEDFYNILLNESVQLLQEVTIRATDNSYLYELIRDCISKSTNKLTKAKVFYELKTFTDNKQIEMLETFYNAEINGYNLTALEMKAGRYALQVYQNRLFTSQNTSRSISLQNITDENQFFPISPFEYKKKKMKKYFILELEKKYKDDNADSIYVINYYPRKMSGAFFTGKIWINPIKKHIFKITFNCENCKIYPFLPLYATDSFTQVDLSITKSFKELNEEMVFNHIDFNYKIAYKSIRTKKAGYAEDSELNYNITTNAVLYAYDFKNQFILPHFVFEDYSTRDYLRINAMPYNDFFWEKNDELKLHDENNSNKQYFNDNNSISNKSIYLRNSPLTGKNSIFETLFTYWSKKRIAIRDVIADTLKRKFELYSDGTINENYYNLSVKIFMDVNSYADSTQIITAAVFDPYETYYHFPIDDVANCFINIYFDLYEIERRKFEKEISSPGISKAEIQKKYNEMSLQISNQKNKYLNEVERGNKKSEMLKWNKYVFENLGIDNFELFNLYGNK